MAWKLNSKAVSWAKKQIAAGKINTGQWDGNKAVAAVPSDNVAEYCQYRFLAVNPDGDPNNKGTWGYPFAIGDEVYIAGLRACITAASGARGATKNPEIADAAKQLLQLANDKLQMSLSFAREDMSGLSEGGKYRIKVLPPPGTYKYDDQTLEIDEDYINRIIANTKAMIEAGRKPPVVMPSDTWASSHPMTTAQETTGAVGYIYDVHRGADGAVYADIYIGNPEVVGKIDREEITGGSIGIPADDYVGLDVQIPAPYIDHLALTTSPRLVNQGGFERLMMSLERWYNDIKALFGGKEKTAPQNNKENTQKEEIMAEKTQNTNDTKKQAPEIRLEEVERLKKELEMARKALDEQARKDRERELARLFERYPYLREPVMLALDDLWRLKQNGDLKGLTLERKQGKTVETNAYDIMFEALKDLAGLVDNTLTEERLFEVPRKDNDEDINAAIAKAVENVGKV